jgi:DNA-binding NarL/FixJ family response regulator
MLGDAIGALLSYRGDFSVVGRSSDIRSCVALAKEGGADVLVIHADIIDPSDLGFLSGAKTFGDFRTVLLHDNGRPKGLAAFDFDKEVSLAGASEHLFEAMNDLRDDVRSRGRYVREGRRRYGGLDLTRREYDVALLVARGLSNRSIAQASGLQEQSVKNLVSTIMRKLHCENRVQVALRLTGHLPEPANLGAK